jgi:hypothetical protein
MMNRILLSQAMFLELQPKPFRTGEYFEFTTKAPAFDLSKSGDLNKVSVVPNPYTELHPGNRQQLMWAAEKGEYFTNLPNSCNPNLYNQRKLVDTIIHESTIDNGEEPGIWFPRMEWISPKEFIFIILKLRDR